MMHGQKNIKLYIYIYIQDVSERMCHTSGERILVHIPSIKNANIKSWTGT